eukprot:7011270-Pyramimonas_sp.AAC.1
MKDMSNAFVSCAWAAVDEANSKTSQKTLLSWGRSDTDELRLSYHVAIRRTEFASSHTVED